MATAVNLILGPAGYTPPAGRAVVLVLGAAGEATGGELLAGAPVALAWVRSTAAPKYCIAAAAWGRAAPGAALAAAAWGRAAPGAATARAAWGAASAAHSVLGLPWVRVPDSPLSAVVGAAWGRPSLAYGAPTRVRWGGSGNVTQAAGAGWSSAGVQHSAARLPWAAAGAIHRADRLRWAAARSADRWCRLPWGKGLLVIAPNDPFPVPPAMPATPGVLRRIRLHFCQPLRPGRLRLQLGVVDCPATDPSTLLIPARPTYMQVHASSAVRQPDGEPVTLWSYELQHDEGAIGWTLTARGPRQILDQLAYDADGLPARLRITLDGFPFDFIVEGLASTRAHGEFGAQITGRSVSALLTDRYAPKLRYLNSVDMTAQQVLADVLAPTGVGLDWGLTDWLVPAGMWSFEGSPMAAIQRVAEAVGALVQSPRTGENVRVAPRYPALPWEWASTTPDFVVESLDPVMSESVTRADKPAYEGVYIIGTTQPVRALVKRTGTAPGLLLPMISDPLMTQLIAAEQRGRAELGACGPQTQVVLQLPVLSGAGEAGVIDPGKLGRIDDPAGAWFGLVRSARVTVATVEEALSVRQSITLERHL